MLQQLLPFTVLKLARLFALADSTYGVATALTVYGIETVKVYSMEDGVIQLQQLLPFTVLKLFCYAFRC